MQLVNFTLKQFLETGKIGPITFGLTKDAIIELIGDNGNDPPPPPGKRLKRHPWQYGPLFLGFRHRRLMHMGFLFNFPNLEETPHLPHPLTVEGYFPTQQTTLPEFEQYLRTESIPYQIYAPETWGSQTVLHIGTGARAGFFSEARRINSIDLLDPQRQKPVPPSDLQSP